jgi:prepilin-type processing-associated H-X9-DG protein
MCPGATNHPDRVRWYHLKTGTEGFGYPDVAWCVGGHPSALLSNIVKPSEKHAVWDIDQWNYSVEVLDPAPVHSGGRNVLYFDGHVRWKRSVSGVNP